MSKTVAWSLQLRLWDVLDNDSLSVGQVKAKLLHRLRTRIPAALRDNTFRSAVSSIRTARTASELQAAVAGGLPPYAGLYDWAENRRVFIN
jgi:hypothetical protein